MNIEYFFQKFYSGASTSFRFQSKMNFIENQFYSENHFRAEIKPHLNYA